MLKVKKVKKNVLEVVEVFVGNVCMVDERMESVIGKLFVFFFIRFY